ncbi:DUF4174 domain-containing protein [Flavisericum labens]|uniref:DUF4174 domain-containing protein n=1 Tax=Flavisericum labens TaxID=3377112 RepID=UPI00387AAD2B
MKINIAIKLIIACFSYFNFYGQNLETHKWKHRIVIIKASEIDSNTSQKQLQEFRNSTRELIDRKIVMYKITGDKFQYIDYSNSKLNHSGKISETLTKRVLNKNIKFEVLLIGLDGGIKLQQKKVLIKEKLFEIIDSMPMRQAELKKRG